MTQEEKAKRYDEAVINGSRLWECGEITRENYEYIFPELKESDDERIRETLIENFKWYCGDYPETTKWGKDDNLLVKDIIAWLEKQAEHARFIEAIQVGDKVTRNEDGVLVNLSQLNRVAKKQGKNNMGISEATKQKLEDNLHKALEKETPESWDKFLDWQCVQKPWSEEDEDILNTIINHFKVDIECTDEDDTVRWLKSLKDRVLPQPRQEWSEEDENRINRLIAYFEDKESFTAEDDVVYVNWLKSLRPQTTWKPTEQQMKVLNEVINFAADHGTMRWNDYIYNVLKGLREQLKKL